MYQVIFKHCLFGDKVPYEECIVVPSLEAGLTLASLLDRISRTLPDKVSYEQIVVEPYKKFDENEKKS